jgi:hypothetical protein
MSYFLGTKKPAMIFRVTGFYFCLAPVYWFYTGFEGVLVAVKTILLGLVLFLFFSNLQVVTRRNFRYWLFRSFFGFWHFVALLVLMSPGFFQVNDFSVATDFFIRLLASYVFCWIGIYCANLFLFRESVVELTKYLWVIAIPCALVVLSGLTGFPDWNNPFLPRNYVSLAEGGFGGTRTSWGTAVAFVYPLLFLKLYLSRDYRAYFYFVVVLSIFIFSVAFPSSRGALIAICSGSVLFFLLDPSSKKIRIPAVIILVAFFAAGVYFFGDHLRLINYDSSGVYTDITSGRTVGFDYGMQLLYERPFFGYGFKNVQINLGSELVDIHNSYLNYALSFGVGAAVFLFASIVTVMIKGIAISQRYPQLVPFLLVGWTALVCGMVEPDILWGQLFSSLIFWVSIGVLIGFLDKQQKRPLD